MNEQDLDRLIDRAAEQIVSREPGRTLTAAVMASVREPEAPAPRGFIWATAAASVVLCGALAIAVMNRAPAIGIQPPISARPLVRPPVVTAPPPVLLPEKAQGRSPAEVRLTRRRPSPMQLPPNDLSAIEPLETEPIALSAIDVPQLERETASIDVIEIEALTIEPLTASND